MKVALIHEVKTPTRGTGKSAGLDLYIPSFTPKFLNEFNARNHDARSMCFFDTEHKNIHIHPHGRAMIPLGIKMEVPEGHALIAFNKTGVSWDDRVVNLSAVIDEDYQGQIFLTLFNFSEYATILKEGQKVIQVVCIPVKYEGVEVVPEEEIHKEASERGEGALGSTGKF